MSFLFFIFSIVQGASKDFDPKQYYALCREIDATNEEVLANYMSQIKLEKDYNKIRDFKNKLDLLKQNNEQKKYCVLRDFKNYYEINDNSWNAILSNITEMHGWGKKRKKISIRRDENFSESSEQLIKKELSERATNINQVYLFSTLEDPFAYSVKVNSKKKGSITINSNFWNQKPLELRQFMSICAVEELTEELSLLPVLLRYWWKSVIPPHKQQDFAGLKKFREMTRIVTMYSACLMSEQAATLVKKYASSVLNSCFSSNDYAFISKVERYWRAINIGNLYCIPRLCLTKSMIHPNWNSLSCENVITRHQDKLRHGSCKNQPKQLSQQFSDYDDVIN